jgi:uncharacterized membrane protein
MTENPLLKIILVRHNYVFRMIGYLVHKFLGIYILSYGFAGSSLQQTAMQCGIQFQIPGAPTSVNTARAMSISTGGMHDRNSFLEKFNDVHSCIFCIIEDLVH